MGMLGSLIANYGQKKADERYNKSQIELQNLTNKQNIEFWQMQNAYNTPLQQMKRFEAAGLNPALMYSQGNPGNAVQIAPSKRPDVRHSNLMMGYNPVESLLSLVSSIAGVKNISADTKIKDTIATGNALDNMMKTRGNILGQETFNSTKQALLARNTQDLVDLGLKNVDLEYKPKFKEEELRQVKNIANKLGHEATSAEKKASVDKLISQTMDSILNGDVELETLLPMLLAIMAGNTLGSIKM